MRLYEVSQDNIKTLQGERKALYAVDEQGRYVQTTTGGWEVEEIVLHQVINDFEDLARQAAVRVRQQEASPIEYYMLKSWMDPLTLAQAMGLYRWQVKRHFKTAVFKKLDAGTLAEYARLFGVTVERLKSFSGEE